MKTIKVGIWGGHGGSAWDDGSYNGIREITNKCNRCSDSIQVLYSDKAGNPVISQKRGGTGGNKTSQIKLQYPDEFLISIIGYSLPVVYGGCPVIRSLILKSNRRSFGPFGIEEVTPFTLSMDGGLIVGFYGRSGWYLDTFGFYLSHVPKTTNLYQAVQQKLQKLGTMEE
ncbi:putative jacalin-like lectin domain-containing protein [Dioscorea sansibarensis]